MNANRVKVEDAVASREQAGTGLPLRAAVFIWATIAAGALLLAAAILQWESADTRQYASYAILALLSSTCKVRLPKLTGTISVNFVVILIGIAVLSLSETVLMAAAAALLQCLWRTSRRPTPVQVAFNVAALSTATAVGYTVPRAILAAMHVTSETALLAMAIVLFFLTNTLLVSEVLALLESKPWRAIWSQCYMWALPYYLVGAAIGGLIVAEGRTVGWSVALLMFPVMYLVYLLYSMLVKQIPLNSMSSSQ